MCSARADDCKSCSGMTNILCAVFRNVRGNPPLVYFDRHVMGPYVRSVSVIKGTGPLPLCDSCSANVAGRTARME